MRGLVRAPGCLLVAACALAALCFPGLAYGNVVTVVHQSVGFTAAATEAAYVVAVAAQPLNAEKAAEQARAGGRSMVVADHTGKRFSCALPDAATKSDARGVMPDGGEDARQRSVSEVLAPLKGLCFYRVEGWWTFELCYRKHVRQFHKENDGTVVAEFILGQFDDNATSSMLGDQTVQEETLPSGVASRYHAHQFTGGTPCDLINRNRSTEVRFVCAPDAAGSGSAATAGAGGAHPFQTPPVISHFVESIKEPTTCHYVLTLSTPALCAHTAFRHDEPAVAHIRCSPLNDTPLDAPDPEAGGRVAGRRSGGADDGEL